jgi:protein-S-isoprenylcysteine O-methyltransferase Ste14
MKRSRSVSISERLRKPVSALLGAILVSYLIFSRSVYFGTLPFEILELIGFGLIFIAALGRVWCAAFINGRKNRELCMGGPYGLCRNPLYFFSLLGLVGVCFGAQSLSGGLVAAILFLVYYHFVIQSEEKRLHALFGTSFEEYCRSTPRFWPQFRQGDPPVLLEVDSRLFLRSLNEVVWFLFSIIAVEALEFLKSSGRIPTFPVPF